MAGFPRSREALNLRIRTEDRELIDQAARARGLNRAEFVLQAARRAAEDALIDQAVLATSPAYVELVAKLDAPPRPSPRLTKSLEAAPPWREK